MLPVQATHYIDSKAENVAESLQSLGGARIVLATAPSAEAAGKCIDGVCHPLQNSQTSSINLRLKRQVHGRFCAVGVVKIFLRRHQNAYSGAA